MMSVRIKEARIELKMTQKELGDLIGIDKSSISQWETGHVKSITSHSLIKLADALGVTASWLESGEGEKYPIQIHGEGCAVIKNDRRLRSSVPLLEWDQVNEHAGRHQKWINCPADHGKNTFALKVASDAMFQPVSYRSYAEKAIIFVDRDVEAVNGCRVVAKLKHGAAIFREYREDAGNRYLKPLNPIYPMIEIDEDIAIIGVVIGAYTSE